MILVLLLCICSLFLAVGGYFAYKRGLLAQFGLTPGGGVGGGLKESAADVKESSAEANAAVSAADAAARKAGLDPDIIKGLAENFGGVTLGSEGGCMFKPVNGVCKPGFTLVDGCCQLNESDPLKRSQVMKQVAKEVGTQILISGVAEKLAKTAGKKFASKLGGKVGSKLVSRAVGKLAGKLGTKMAAKGAIMGAKMAKNASMGPVGAAMMVFDIMSMALDFADVGGYATFTANSVNTRTRNGIEFQLENIAKSNNMDYPLLFPVGDAFPEEYEAVSNKISAHFMSDILDDISKNDPKAIEDLIGATIAAEETGEEFEIPESFIDLFGKTYDAVTKRKHMERDKFIYDEMQKVLPDDKKDQIENFTHMSTPNRMGVSLSKKGADAWNASKRAEYLDKFDALKPKELPEDYMQPMYAMYTQNYRVVNAANPGKADNPNMVTKKLSKPATIGGYYGMLVAYCEKPRKTSGKTINLYDQGVRFDPNTGTCRFTSQYCTKMGMKYDGGGDTDCKNYPGQKVAEMIFGTTVTRGAIKTANDVKKTVKKNINDLTSGNPKKMATAAAKMLIDPFGINKKIVKAVVPKSVQKAVNKAAKKTTKAVSTAARKTTKAVASAGKSVGKGLKKLFCFSPNTPVRLASGELVLMKDLKLGDVLVGGIVVDAVMQIRNAEDPHYKIFSKELNDYIYVTGSHYIKHGDKYVEVRDYPGAEPAGYVEEILSCLVTSDHTIPVGEYTFWDWEDNLVPLAPETVETPITP